MIPPGAIRLIIYTSWRTNHKVEHFFKKEESQEYFSFLKNDPTL